LAAGGGGDDSEAGAVGVQQAQQEHLRLQRGHKLRQPSGRPAQPTVARGRRNRSAAPAQLVVNTVEREMAAVLLEDDMAD